MYTKWVKQNVNRKTKSAEGIGTRDSGQVIQARSWVSAVACQFVCREQYTGFRVLFCQGSSIAERGYSVGVVVGCQNLRGLLKGG